MSILFFLYVFGYLLRSKRRKELKRRQRKMSKWRAAAAATLGTAKSDTAVAVEDEGVVTATPNRFLSSLKNSSRRRISATQINNNNNESPEPQHKPLQWTPSSVSLNVVDESTISYAMSSANVIAPSGGNGSSSNAIRRGNAPGSKYRKMKVSDNEHSHGSFFLRAGAVGMSFSNEITASVLAVSFFSPLLCNERAFEIESVAGFGDV